MGWATTLHRLGCRGYYKGGARVPPWQRLAPWHGVQIVLYSGAGRAAGRGEVGTAGSSARQGSARERACDACSGRDRHRTAGTTTALSAAATSDNATRCDFASGGKPVKPAKLGRWSQASDRGRAWRERLLAGVERRRARMATGVRLPTRATAFG